MATNPYQKYQQQSVMTMTRGEMLIRLYDETIKQLSVGTAYLTEKDFEGSNRALQKAQRILNHLRVTLDFQYEISDSLNALYEYFIYQIIQSNLHKDATPLAEIISMISDLRSTFVQADRSARLNEIAG